MNDSASQLDVLLKQYKKTSRAIEVNFREMVHDIKSTERLTHLIHPYPAKLLVHIPKFFLSNNILSQPGDSVLDPFSGSGTVLLESMEHGRNPIGADCNPIARLISKVKTTYIDPDILTFYLGYIIDLAKKPASSELPKVINLEYWYSPHVIKQLHAIHDAIQSIEKEDVKDFFEVCFSNCVKKTSYANPRFSVPVKLKKDTYSKGHKLREKTVKRLKDLESMDVYSVFKTICEKNINRNKSIEHLQDFRADLYHDARNLSLSDDKSVNDNSVSLVVTSPPYAGAQKYVRAQSLNLGWLGYCEKGVLTHLKAKTIGREDYRHIDYKELTRTNIKSADNLLEKIWTQNPQRAHIAGQYLVEMRQAFKEWNRVLKKDGHLVLVAGNNQVCGHEFKTVDYLHEVAIQEGLTSKLCLVDNIQSRGLMTKRNKTAGIINSEWVYIFKK